MTMSDPEPRVLYREVSDRVFALYDEERYGEALRLVDDHRGALAAWDSEVAMLAACLAVRAGDPGRAARELQESLDRGGWWDPAVLDGDEDLDLVRHRPGYAALREVSARRWADANRRPDRSGDALIEVHHPRGLLVALHGAEEDADDAVAAWAGVARSSRLALLAVRSSQRTSPAYRTWPDTAQALAEVSAAWSDLPEALRSLPLVAAGFSAGGRIALQWAAGAHAPAPAGVLAVAPAVDVDRLPESPSGLALGHVWIGAEDDLLDDVVGCRSVFETMGVGLTVLPGVGHRVDHAVQSDAVARIGRALGQRRASAPHRCP